MNQTIKRIIFFIAPLLLLFPSVVSAQTDSISILESMIPEAQSDREFYDIYFRLAEKLYASNPDKGIGYAFKALEYADNVGDDACFAGANAVMAQTLICSGLPDSAMFYARNTFNLTGQGKASEFRFSAINTMGNIHNEFSNWDSTLFYYKMALDHAQLNENQENIASACNNMGMIYSDIGDVQKSYEYYLKALKLFEVTGNLGFEAIVLNNIATINQQNEDYDRSIEYLKRAIAINQKLGKYYHLSTNYSNLGISYKELELYDTALVYYLKSHELNEKYGFNSDHARYYFNLGNLYFNKGDLKLAREHFDKSVEVTEQQGIRLGVLFNNLRLFDLDIIEKRFAMAKQRLRVLEEVIHETNQLGYITDLLHRRSTYYETVGDYKKALEVYKAYHDHVDSIRELDYKSNVANLQEKYESEKKTRENLELRDEVLLQEKTIQYQYLLVLFVMVVLVFTLVIAAVLFKSRAKLSRANSALTSLNLKVNNQKANLEVANATKDKMFSIIAHDLRSPFNTLLGFLDLLVSEYDDLDDTEKKNLLKTLNLQSIKTFGLLENLLQWSMMQRGLVKLDMANYNMYQLVTSQLNELSHRSETKNVELVNLVDKSMEIKADEVMIKTILRNLVNNSIKFSNSGDQVKIRAVKNAAKFSLYVEDQGVGMTQKYADQLFTKQIPDSTPGTGNEHGSGLGLRIVKDFVDMMDGEIHVDSSPGEGTVFCITINNQ